MAAEARNVSGGKGWSNGDIFQLVALLIGIPAAVVAFVVLAAYYRRRRQRRRGETLFPRSDRVQRPLGAYTASQTQDRVLGEAAGSRDTNLLEGEDGLWSILPV
ncbi:hypothetical protein GT037_000090, partial [Alternaria burnsii]